ncbi:hypothetical protein [Sinorhizobium sp. CCBAU 05631]|uniref:hypothetical protein n=1 Tax=Sinorhizobium sp. CCBAU 05631 TaxID=794846 RepID=UPI0012FA67C3|nr:hypothetical protein [Sinorhizobium sp. CCBAU 05631]
MFLPPVSTHGPHIFPVFYHETSAAKEFAPAATVFRSNASSWIPDFAKVQRLSLTNSHVERREDSNIAPGHIAAQRAAGLCLSCSIAEKHAGVGRTAASQPG